ncbi:unnamed protein product [Lota lota]
MGMTQREFDFDFPRPAPSRVKRPQIQQMEPALLFPPTTSGKHSATLVNIRARLTRPPGSEPTGMTKPYHSPGLGQV